MKAIAATLVLLVFGSLAPPVLAEADAPRAPAKAMPLFLSLDQVKMEIVSVKFEVEVQGVDSTLRVPTNSRDKYRLALVTLRIRKPAGMKLTLAAADLTFHYWHGSEPEVAPAEGLSGFNTSLDGERPMKLYQSMGPGWVKQTTSPRVTESGEIYVDTVFHMVEPDTRECWIGVAQPSQQAPYLSKGWTPGEK